MRFVGLRRWLRRLYLCHVAKKAISVPFGLCRSMYWWPCFCHAQEFLACAHWPWMKDNPLTKNRQLFTQKSYNSYTWYVASLQPKNAVGKTSSSNFGTSYITVACMTGVPPLVLWTAWRHHTYLLRHRSGRYTADLFTNTTLCT